MISQLTSLPSNSTPEQVKKTVFICGGIGDRDMFQIRNDLNEEKTDVIFYKETTIDQLFDLVDRERKNSYGITGLHKVRHT